MLANQHNLRLFSFCSCSTITVAFLATILVFTAIDSASANMRLSPRGIDIASIMFNAISLLFVVTLTISRLVNCQNDRPLRWFLLWIGALVSFIASTLSLNLFLKTGPEKDSPPTPKNLQIDTTTEVAIWAISYISQISFYALVSLLSVLPTESASKGEKRGPAPQRPPTPPTLLRMSSPAFAIREQSEPSPSRFSAESRRGTWRDSLQNPQHMVRPITSQTQVLETLPSNLVPSNGIELESIPGSRPASPANALNGRFPVPDAPSDRLPVMPLLEGSLTSYSNPSSQKLTHMGPTGPPAHESHIHPLFRTDSPTPTPPTSPRTMVVASPFSGQVINAPPRAYNRIRSDSGVSARTSRPSSRAASSPAGQMPSQAGSFEGCRSESRSSSPSGSSNLSMPRMPPIPEFVLSVSKEHMIQRSDPSFKV